MNKKTLKIILIIFLSILVIILSIFFANILTNKNFRFRYFNFKEHKISKELVFNQEYETIFNNIKINSNSSDIEIKKSMESKIKVIIYGDKDEFEVETSDQTLDIISSSISISFICSFILILPYEFLILPDFKESMSISPASKVASKIKLSKLSILTYP